MGLLSALLACGMAAVERGQAGMCEPSLDIVPSDQPDTACFEERFVVGVEFTQEDPHSFYILRESFVHSNKQLWCTHWV